jgi:hypothetical protein
MHTPDAYGGRRRSHGLKTKTLRRMLKKKGMKTTGKKATLMKRLHMRGGADGDYTHKLAYADGKYKVVKVDGSAESLFPDSYDSATAAAAAVTEAAPPGAKLDTTDPNAPTEEGGKRRRRRSRRREEGGRRHRHSRRGKEMLGY